MVRSALLGTLGLLAVPAVATAQFQPAIVPPNPLYNSHPAYRFQLNFGVTVPTAFGRAFVGTTIPFTPAPQLFSRNYNYPTPLYGWSLAGMNRSGYISGGSGSSVQAQRDFEKAQREAGRAWANLNPDAAKNIISDQAAYEKLGVLGLPGTGPDKAPPDALVKALAASDESEVASGEALNQILAAIAASEAKGAKGISAFVAPQMLDSIRFTGGPADALNLVRRAGRLPFPAAFDAPELSDLRDTLDRDFTAVAAPLLAGKSVDTVKLAALERTLKRIEDVSPPVLRNMSFEDAIAARKFLNQFANAVRVMKAGINGVVVPAWATEGTNVADLTRHMTRHKLKFGPAPEGEESAYLALHKALVTYLFVLTQGKK